MSDLLFVFGNSPDLSRAELVSVLPRFAVTPNLKALSPNLFLLEDTPEIDNLGTRLMEILGGTVKIARVFAGAVNRDEIVLEITRSLKEGSRHDFALSWFSEKINSGELNSISKTIKENLGEAGIKARYFLPRNGTEVSGVVVSKQHLREIMVIKTAGGYTLAETEAVQAFEDWGKRDYGRPEVEGHIGMLPPKVARMMVNLSGVLPDKPLLDPFCGTGTVPAEAMVLGFTVYGSDINPEQVKRSRENLAWLASNYKLTGSFAIETADAVRVSGAFPGIKFGAIITEPDLGPNQSRPGRNVVRDLTRLENLYTEALSEWKKILIPGGSVVIALPSFGKNSVLVKKVVDKARAMGYSFSQGPYIYARPGAQVSRNICVFNI